MRKRTAKEARCESDSGRELTRFQQWRYNGKLKTAKRKMLKRAFHEVDWAVGKGLHEVEFNVKKTNHYSETIKLGVGEALAIPNFFTNYEVDSLHAEVVNYIEQVFKSFGYKVTVEEDKDFSLHSGVNKFNRVKLEWSGKYGDACGES